MPNWCSTDIRIVCNSNESAELLFKKIEKYRMNQAALSDNRNWLGNIKSGFGIKDDVPIRGWIIDVNLDRNEVRIWQDDAWTPKVLLWEKVIESEPYLSDAELLYLAEEPGCDILATNDPSVDGTYQINFYGDNCQEPLYELSELDVIGELRDILATSIDNLELLINMAKDRDIKVSRWEYIDSKEWI